MHVLLGRALGAANALQVQDDLIDSCLDGSMETALLCRDPGEEAGAAACNADHPFDRRDGPLRRIRALRCLARLGKDLRAYGASRLAPQLLQASGLNAHAHPVRSDLKLPH